MTSTMRDTTPNVALYNLRDAAGLTQRELAEALNKMAREYGEAPSIEANHVSRWERGTIGRPRPAHQRMLARIFEVSIEELGFTRPRQAPPNWVEDRAGDALDFAMVDGRPVLVDPSVDRSQNTWKATRRRLNRLRRALSTTAVELYPAEVRLGDTGLIAAEGWLQDQPISLDDVRLISQFDAPAAQVSGGEPESARMRPLATVTRRYGRYSHAMREVDRPTLFENRLSYRLVGLHAHGHVPTMTIGLTTYFDMVDICETVAHEVAAAHLRDESDKPEPASWRRLPFRRLIDNPFDLNRRALLPSIDTLTIRASRDGASFILHQRDPLKVAVAGGELHLMPAGVFQPSSIYPAAQHADLDLWRNVQREYSEEFLGNPEHGGDGAPADYSTEPFVTLDRAKAAGNLNISYLGTALDALTLATEVLTVAVIDADTYDAVFAGLVNDNSEGTIVQHGRTHPSPAVPFAEPVVRQLLDDGRLAPAAAGCLRLAWEHRHQILGL